MLVLGAIVTGMRVELQELAISNYDLSSGFDGFATKK